MFCEGIGFISSCLTTLDWKFLLLWTRLNQLANFLSFLLLITYFWNLSSKKRGKMGKLTLLLWGISSCNAFIFSLIRSLRLCIKNWVQGSFQNHKQWKAMESYISYPLWEIMDFSSTAPPSWPGSLWCLVSCSWFMFSSLQVYKIFVQHINSCEILQAGIVKKGRELIPRFGTQIPLLLCPFFCGYWCRSTACMFSQNYCPTHHRKMK